MAFKLDIFKTLKAIDLKDRNWLSKQSPEERAAFVPTVVIRWLSGYARNDKAGDDALIKLADTANRVLYELQDFPDQQYRLMAGCGAGYSRHHAWIAAAKHRQKADKITEFLLRFWPDAHDDELEIVINQFDKKSFASFIDNSGCDPSEAKDLKKIYDKLKKMS